MAPSEDHTWQPWPPQIGWSRQPVTHSVKPETLVHCGTRLPRLEPKARQLFPEGPDPRDGARATLRFGEHALGKMPPFPPGRGRLGDGAKGTGAFRR